MLHLSVRFCGLAALCAACAFAAQENGPEPVSAADWFERGVRASESQDWPAAAEAFARAAAADPTRPEYRFRQAVTLYRAQQEASAIALLQDVVREEPRYREAAVQLAGWYLQQRRAEETIALLAPHAEDAMQYDVQQALGRACLLLGRPSQAREHVAHCISARPASGVDQYLLGECHRLEGRPALASQAYLAGLGLGYETAELHARLAETLHARGRDVAEVRIVKATRGLAGTLYGPAFLLDPLPDEPAIYRACGAGSALFHVHQAVAMGSSTPALLQLLGDVSLATLRYQEALDAYRRVMADLPEDTPVDWPPPRRASVEYNMGQACLGMGDVDAFLDHVRAAAAADQDAFGPRLFDAYHVAAARWTVEGDRTRCIEALQQAARQRPDDATTRFRLGEALWEDGRRADAVRQWRITLEFDPHHPQRDRILAAIRDVGRR